MNPAVVGLAGRIGSGKSSVSEALVQSLGWRCASFGEYVRSVARIRGLGENREALQELGASLVARDVEDFCNRVLESSGWSTGSPLIIQGVRHYEVVQTLRNLVSPLRLFVVYLQTDTQTRMTRLDARGDVDIERVRQLDRHSTEIQVAATLADAADLRVDADGAPIEIAAAIISGIERLCGAT
jgi:dephospho-CoA kinase